MSDLVLKRDFDAKILEYIDSGRSAATKRQYSSDWRLILKFCEAHGLLPLPMTPEVMSAIIIDSVESGLSLSTLEHRLATISAAHRAAGLTSPITHEGVRLVLKGAKRKLRDSGRARSGGKKPLLISDLLAILATMGSRPKDVRDRAILLVGWSAALRRSELCGLDIDDVEADKRGVLLCIRTSKTDKVGVGQYVPIRSRERYCPVAALRSWLDLCGSPTEGPVFRSIKNGQVMSTRLDGRDVARLVKQHVSRMGLDPAGYAGHSLRSGLVVSAREGGAGEVEIMRITRHESIAGLAPYIRKGDLWLEDPAGKAGLR
jgi:integrase